MKTNCPNCSNRLFVDDTKVPDTPFMLKCQKCQSTVKLPGKAVAASAVARPAPLPPPSKPVSPPASAPPATPPPPAASSMGPALAPMGPALVSLASSELGNGVSVLLSRLGFSVEPLNDDTVEEKMQRLQQGEYSMAAVSRSGVPQNRDIYAVVRTLSPELRRRVFLLMVGDEFKTGEGTQAFAVVADLVVQGKDALNCDHLLKQTLLERRRLYQTFWDVNERKREGRL